MGSTTSTLLAATIIFLALTPQALAADGVDFSNNLFTDLAPVLTLFGEQVSKQFLSQSLTWLEDVIFAMAPLGIITAIVSAIRVGGPNWLKAVVGRARESRAVAEVELMSSTSHEVCELWNGEAIVRVMGSPEVAEILYFEDGTDGQGGPRFLSLEAAKQNGILRNAKKRREDDTAPISAPNISLNICEAKEQGELWLFAILGIVLQFGCLIFIGVTRYHPKINLKEDKDSKYAYPLMASGTLFVVIGMMACSRVVQASSEEDIWVAERSFRILWLQKSSRVNDQLFGSYALFGNRERKKLITSRRRAHRYSSWTSISTLAIAGSFVCIAGFVTQFVGLRALHWSASIAQLVVTLTMAAARTWIRRKMSKRPQPMTLPVGDEIDGLTLTFGKSPDKLWGAENPYFRQNYDSGWEVITPHKYLGYEGGQEAHNAPNKDAQNIISMRMDLGYSTSWKGSSDPFVQELDACLQSLLACLTDRKDVALVDNFKYTGVFRWALPVKVDGIAQCITMTATRRHLSSWVVDASELRAVISLWCYGVKLEDARNTKRLRRLGADPQGVLRVLGPATRRFIRDCERWMDRGRLFAVVENRRLRDKTNQEQVTGVRAQELSETIASMGGYTADTTYSRTDFIARHRIIGAEPTNNDGCYNSLTFVSTAPLRQMYAQEILSSFLWAIVGIVRSINGDTRYRSATPLGDHDERPCSTLENSIFRRLAAIITNSGVTSNTQDAYALIIPPFATADKLPRMPSNEPTQDEIEPI
ncbi:hypothetical protein HOY80DRAFT_879893 [Tuber brumale]|nr:hypothetical protein HOY80DRAFT_879893 [Tuber brumale]